MIPYSRLRSEPRQPLAGPTKYPLALTIEPTNRCNLHCPFCAQAKSGFRRLYGPKKDMDVDLFAGVLTDAMGMKLKVLRLYGIGEPFMHPRFTEMVDIAQGFSDRIEITTNGTLPMALPKLVTPTYLRVSIYGDDPRPLQNLTALERQPLLHVSATGIGFFPEQMYRRVCDETIAVAHHDWNGFDAPPKEPVRRACAFPFLSLYVCSDGTALACCNDWSRGTRVGNLNRSTLSEVWGGPEMILLREMHLAGRQGEVSSCANCVMQPPDEVRKEGR
jgi:MoaA/NifB/PqqE/SkfB family radical SAM enzyme